MFTHRVMQFVYKRQPEAIFMKSYFGKTDWENIVSAKDYMGAISIPSYCLLSALTIPLDSKVLYPKRITTPKSLLMLSVNNEQFNYYRILWKYTYTDNSKWLITLSCHWHWNTAYINFWSCTQFWIIFRRQDWQKFELLIKQMSFLKLSLSMSNPISRKIWVN